MRILVANNQLDIVGGSETFTFTIIEELVRLSHQVEYFTFKKGFVSSLIEDRLNVTFMSKQKYDLILANHNTTVELLHKKGFTIQTCHGIFPKLEQPSPKADAYVSISQEVQDHLAKLGYPSILIHNSINLKRFTSKNKINKEPQNVLSLCHSEEANRFIENACLKMNLNFSKAYKYESPVWEIEEKINNADLVIGLGRSAYEAMACGRPVVIYDNRRYFKSCGDGYAKDNLGLYLKNNCSGRYSNQEFDQISFIKELNKYNDKDSNYFRKFAETELDVMINIRRYFDFFNFIIHKKNVDKRNKKIKLAKSIIGHKNFNRIARLIKKKAT